MQHLIFLSFQYRKYSNCYIIALQYFLKYGSAIIQQLLHLIFLFLQVEHIAIAILLHCNILIILQCNNIAIAIFSISCFKLQFYQVFKFLITPQPRMIRALVLRYCVVPRLHRYIPPPQQKWGWRNSPWLPWSQGRSHGPVIGLGHP